MFLSFILPHRTQISIRLKTVTRRQRIPVSFWGNFSGCWPRRKSPLRPTAVTSLLSSARTVQHRSKQLDMQYALCLSIPE